MKNQNYLTVTEFAKEIGIHPQTVREWDRMGRLKAHHKTIKGKRFYTTKQVEEYKEKFFTGEKTK